MLLFLSNYLKIYFHAFHVVQYITFRSILSALTALIISLLIGPIMIRKLTYYQIGQIVREDGPETHLKKTGTPTMGGLLIIVAIIASVLLCGDLTNRYILLISLVLIGFGIIGFVDDYKKLVLKNSRGLVGRWKYFWQSLISIAAVIFLYHMAKLPVETQLILPFFKDVIINMGILYIVLGYFVIVGTSNAVNLTDGLDGLAILPIVLVVGALGIFAYLTGHAQFSHYLGIPYIPGVGEVAVFCSAMVGSGLGFLWFNAYPAQIIMGDVGSLGLGAALGVIAITVRQELVLMLMGGVFVAETLSVILQVGSFKLRKGKRIFRMAPLHHHFELQGWPEPRIIVRFWIITFVLVLCGLATLKLR